MPRDDEDDRWPVLIRPNGMVERLTDRNPPAPAYAAPAMIERTRRDRRRRPRPALDPLRGRLLDLSS